MASKEDLPSDRSSPNEFSAYEPTTQRSQGEEMLAFLDDNTLVYRHYGLRAIILGDSSVSFSRSMNKSSDGQSRTPQQNSSRINPILPPESDPESQQTHTGTTGSEQKETEVPKRTAAVNQKYSFTPDESKVYHQFAEFLSNFESEEMLEIISSVLKRAKEYSAD